MNDIEQLKQRVAELEAYVSARKVQQLSNPLDVASKSVINAPIGEGAGSTTLTQTLNLTGEVQQITTPALFASSVIVVIGGVRYEFPSFL